MLTGLNGSIWISFLHIFKTCYFVLSSILSSKWALDAIVVVSVVVTAFAWHDSETIYNHGENYACMAQDKTMKNKTIFAC